jgi:parallel beta-helix repeat protein
MPHNRAGLLALVPLASFTLFAACGKSGKGPTSVLAPPPDTAVVVSSNPNDHPDFLCTGVADDVPINLAIQRADSASHWTVLLKQGTYHVHHGINVTSFVTLRGSGSGTVIRLDDNAPSMLDEAGIVRIKDGAQSGVAKRVQQVTLEDFVVDGNRDHQAPGVGEKKFGFYAEGDFITFRRLVARNCAGYGFDPHAHQDSIPSTSVSIEDCEAFGNEADGFVLDNVRNSTFRRDYAHDNDRHGFNLVTTSADMTLSNCRALRNGGAGLMAQNGTHDVVIEFCELAENALQGMFLRDADGCTVSGNAFRANRRSGLLLRLADHTTIAGNSFTESDTGSIGRAVVTLDSAFVNVLSANNVASTRARAGVLEMGTSDYNQVMDNIIGGPTLHVVLIGPHSTQIGNQLRVP